MVPTSQWKFGIDHAGLNPKLTKEEFQSIAPVDIVDENNRLAADKFEFEKNIYEKEFVAFRSACRILCQEGRCGGFRKGEDCL